MENLLTFEFNFSLAQEKLSQVINKINSRLDTLSQQQISQTNLTKSLENRIHDIDCILDHQSQSMKTDMAQQIELYFEKQSQDTNGRARNSFTGTQIKELQEIIGLKNQLKNISTCTGEGGKITNDNGQFSKSQKKQVSQKIKEQINLQKKQTELKFETAKQQFRKDFQQHINSLKQQIQHLKSPSNMNNVSNGQKSINQRANCGRPSSRMNSKKSLMNLSQSRKQLQMSRRQSLDRTFQFVENGEFREGNFEDILMSVRKEMDKKIQSEIKKMKDKISLYISNQQPTNKQTQANSPQNKNKKEKARFKILEDQVQKALDQIQKQRKKLSDIQKRVFQQVKKQGKQGRQGKQNKEKKNLKAKQHVGSQKKLFFELDEADLMQSSHPQFKRAEGGFKEKKQRSTKKVNLSDSSKIQLLENTIESMNNRMTIITERLNQVQNGRRDSGGQFLPKIDRPQQNKNTNDMVSLKVNVDLLRKQLQQSNEQIRKLNERLMTTKTRLKQLSESHSVIPQQIKDLYNKLREYNQIQEDRLIQLIKQLINRCLVDPFNNTFTNTLKREINVKFLQIKHQYYSILKQIQNKVEDRAQRKQIGLLKDKLQQNLLQCKSLINKKCDNQDYKKGIKYLEGKLKDVYGFLKGEAPKKK